MEINNGSHVLGRQRLFKQIEEYKIGFEGDKKIMVKSGRMKGREISQQDSTKSREYQLFRNIPS